MKSLKPSHREKKRYLLIKGKDANKKNIEEVILEFIGVLGYAECSPIFIKNDKKKLILAINREALNKVRSSFLISKKDINIDKVSGNISSIK